MHVSGHQDLRVNANQLAFRKRCQRTRKHPIITHSEENRGPIDPPQHDVYGEAGGDNAGASGQTDLLLFGEKGP